MPHRENAASSVRGRRSITKEYPGNEGGTTRGGALLGVVGGKLRALGGDAVDVWRLVAHQTLIVGAQVQVADIIAKNNYDVRLFSILLRRCGVGCVSNGHRAGG